jgi:hypothetical protein
MMKMCTGLAAASTSVPGTDHAQAVPRFDEVESGTLPVSKEARVPWSPS